MIVRRLALALAVAALPALSAGTAHAQQASSSSSPATERMGAMERMQRDMMAAMNAESDPDRRFAAMLIPHHQGALDMARDYLREGRDPQLRAMAEKTIREQGQEIAELRRWQGQHPAR